MKNNVPRYIILDFAQIRNEESFSASEALDSARKLIKKHLPAFQELAK
jgi:antitoxin Phd